MESVALSADGNRLATGSSEEDRFKCATYGSARLWDAHNGQVLREFKSDQYSVLSLALSADGSLLAAGGSGYFDEPVVLLWDAHTGRTLQEFRGHTDDVIGVAMSADGSRLVTASKDKTARLWDTRTGQTLLEFKGHTNALTSVAMSADDNRLVTASEDTTARLWDAGILS